MKKHIYLITLTGLLLTLFCLAGCTAGQKLSIAPVSGAGDEVIVRLESRLDKNGGQIANGYSHPYRFSVEEMALEIDSLVMNDYEMGKWNKKSSWEQKSVFIQKTADELATKLTTTLAGAGQSEAIVFVVPGRRGTQTQGELFIKDNLLTWQFYKVDSMPFTGSDKFWMDSDDWRIQEAPQFTIYVDKRTRVVTVLRDLQIDKGLIDSQSMEDQQWRNKLLQSDATVAPPQLNKFQSMEEKLETLKRWSDKGLISEEEYRKEKESILDQLQ
jgi:hypothetical protein